MITSELVAYVKQSLAQGATQDQIRTALAAQGWLQEDIGGALSAASAVPIPAPSPMPAQPVMAARGPMESIQQPGHFSAGLEQQFPLSPRKFWKKLIQQMITWLVLALFLAAAIVLAVLTLHTADDAGSAFGSGIVLAIVLWLFCMALYAWYVKVYIRRYYYDANDSFVTIKKGVFAPAEIHVQYAKIQDVYVDQDILDRIMGLYDVHLASATVASGMEAHIDGVDAAAAQGLKDFLLGKLRSGGSSSAMAGGTSMPAVGAGAAPATFTGDISSATYPIAGAWVVQQAIAWIFTSAFYAILVDAWLVLPGKNGESSLATDLNFAGGTFLGVGLTVFVLFYVAHLVYSLLWRSTFSFAFLADYVVTKQGIIAKRETHLPYRSVQDVTVSQGIIERLFGLATVRIENAAQMVGPKGQRVSSALKLPGQLRAKANEISDALKQVALSHSASGTGL